MFPVISLLVAGCEEGRQSPGDGHDFGANSPGVVVAFGDSITRGDQNGVSAPYPSILASLTGRTVVNAGVGGEQSEEGVQRVSSVLSGNNPGYLLILFGANDLLHGQSPSYIVGNIRTIAETARAAQTIPIIATMTPTTGTYEGMTPTIATINSMLRAMAATDDYYIADLGAGLGNSASYLLPDGLHPNQAAHDVMARIFANVLTN